MSDRGSLLDRKPIPSLAAWLGDGARGEGFEAWVRESLAVETIAGNDDEAAVARIIRTLSIGLVEAGRIEVDRHGRDWGVTMLLLARCAGVAIACQTLTDVRDDAGAAGVRRVERLLLDEFREGVQFVGASVRRNRG